MINSCALTFLAFSVLAKEVAISKDPIQVKLPLGEEVRIDFPESIINLNIPTEADNALTTLLKPDGTLFWQAENRFDKARVLATSAKGELFILDIEMGKNADKTIILVRKKAENKGALRPNGTHKGTSKKNTQDPYALMPKFLKQQYDTSNQSTAEKYSYADMAVFAMQHYIGPKRLIADLPAQRIRLKPIKANLIRVWGNDLSLKLLNQWVLDGHYITSLKVTNKSAQTYQFDPRAIRGQYLFVASLHDVLQPRGSTQNETIWVFITKQPFAKAFGQKW